MKKDPDKIAAIEKAISKKYGKEAIQNPKGNWNEEKEKEFTKQIKKFAEKHQRVERMSEMVEVDGIFISKKLLNRDSNRSCPVCNKYSLSKNSDVYLIKFDCCYECYVQYVEDREERWNSGWRPDENYKKTRGHK
tara:strand:- start:86 stop:490 length:405 start_codon:yes stop_codon:yes gene_type:complete